MRTSANSLTITLAWVGHEWSVITGELATLHGHASDSWCHSQTLISLDDCKQSEASAIMSKLAEICSAITPPHTATWTHLLESSLTFDPDQSWPMAKLEWTVFLEASLVLRTHIVILFGCSWAYGFVPQTSVPLLFFFNIITQHFRSSKRIAWSEFYCCSAKSANTKAWKKTPHTNATKVCLPVTFPLSRKSASLMNEKKAILCISFEQSQ